MPFTNSIATKCQGQFQVTGLDANGYSVGVQGGLTPTCGQTTCTSANTPYQLSATSVPCKMVTISPSPTGSAAIYVGTSAAGLNASPVQGVFIPAGVQPITIQVADVSLLWVRSASAADSVGWMALN